MSIKIHHGPPGSYKTSGAVMDDFIPAARAGRIIVTNVRGLCDPEKIRSALGDHTIPDTFELHHFPTTEHPDAAKNREDFARWWHWLPQGALLLLDEAQMIWPKTWKESDLKALDFPGGLDAATAVNRPFNWQTAFEMHRHYGWDMVLTTPNIDRMRPDVRQCAEGAYKHKNQAIIGLRGFYLEAFHMADDSGKSASDFLTLRNRRIRPEVWKLYDSTATGTHSDTIAGLSILASPRVLVMLGVLTCSVLWFVQSGPPAVLGGSKGTPVASPSSTSSGSGASQNPANAPNSPKMDTLPATPSNPANGRDNPHSRENAIVIPILETESVHLVGRYGLVAKPHFLFELSNKQGRYHLTDTDLNALGFAVEIVSKCLIRLVVGESVRLIYCKPRTIQAPSEREEVRRLQQTAQLAPR